MIYFLGDVHGGFDHLYRFFEGQATDEHASCSLIFLGDIESPRPFEDMIRPLLDAGSQVWFIHGNHDTNRSDSWKNLQDSQHRNLNGRVEIIDGLKVAGLGGVFRGEVWYPGMKCHEETTRAYSPPNRNFNSYADYVLRSHDGRFKNETILTGKLLKHQSTIFPEIVDSLKRQRADILVTHEAPDGHPHGFTELGRLAINLGVRHYFHGHHHDNRDYREWSAKTGIQLHGVGYRGITTLSGEVIVPGEPDGHAKQGRYEQHSAIHATVN